MAEETYALLTIMILELIYRQCQRIIHVKSEVRFMNVVCQIG
jgi:hypothetical protein